MQSMEVDQSRLQTIKVMGLSFFRFSDALRLDLESQSFYF